MEGQRQGTGEAHQEVCMTLFVAFVEVETLPHKGMIVRAMRGALGR